VGNKIVNGTAVMKNEKLKVKSLKLI